MEVNYLNPTKCTFATTAHRQQLQAPRCRTEDDSPSEHDIFPDDADEQAFAYGDRTDHPKSKLFRQRFPHKPKHRQYRPSEDDSEDEDVEDEDAEAEDQQDKPKEETETETEDEIPENPKPYRADGRLQHASEKKQKKYVRNVREKMKGLMKKARRGSGKSL